MSEHCFWLTSSAPILDNEALPVVRGTTTLPFEIPNAGIPADTPVQDPSSDFAASALPTSSATVLRGR